MSELDNENSPSLTWMEPTPSKAGLSNVIVSLEIVLC